MGVGAVVAEFLRILRLPNPPMTVGQIITSAYPKPITTFGYLAYRSVASGSAMGGHEGR